MEHLSLRELLGEPGGVQEGSGDGHLFPWGPCWETLERFHTQGAYVWKNVLGQVSPYRGPVGELREGVRLPGTLKIS
jgi:hypothetical protein